LEVVYMSPNISKKQQGHVNKYIKNTYDRVIVTFKKKDDAKERIKTASTKTGESVNSFIVSAVMQKVESIEGKQ